ncbi:Xaa-Pro peptidase family protein [Bordetella sp. BOR01]|uniref:M24 family metallopeptidase n=1 Tax=Bordetella sp. BOR01 TaxID=2854779 RepID=UPI001C44A7D0|nr:Xaa-Pro peptidase family protein [Bordetella sp. BOR01]MBV7483159.1 Xaa-Pro peptidase family protein [Bordetella sp. BOR01]
MNMNDDAWAMPVAELERRRDGVLAWMSKNDVPIVAVTDPESVLYLTGISLGGRPRGKALLLAEDGRHLFVTRSLECHWQDHWASRSWCKVWALHGDDETLAQALAFNATVLAGKNPRRIGLELSRPGLSYVEARQLGAVAQDQVDVSGAIIALRRIKSSSELKAMRRAGELSMAGVTAAAQAIRAGGNGADATAAAFAALIGGAGGQSPVSGPHVTSGTRTAMAHSAWDHAVPQQGDSVVFVMTGTCERYTAPIEWTCVRGEPDRLRARMIDACTQAADAVMQGLRPGMTSHEGDLLCRRVIEDAGFAAHFMNRAAYGIGLSAQASWMESLVQLKPDDHSEIVPGMTMHLVPALHVPGHGFIIRSMAFEVTATGCASLRPPMAVETAI